MKPRPAALGTVALCPSKVVTRVLQGRVPLRVNFPPSTWFITLALRPQHLLLNPNITTFGCTRLADHSDSETVPSLPTIVLGFQQLRDTFSQLLHAPPRYQTSPSLLPQKTSRLRKTLWQLLSSPLGTAEDTAPSWVLRQYLKPRLDSVQSALLSSHLLILYSRAVVLQRATFLKTVRLPQAGMVSSQPQSVQRQSILTSSSAATWTLTGHTWRQSRGQL